MSIRFFFAAVLLHIACVESNKCPTLAQMGPCKCQDGSWGLEIFCSGNLVDEIRDALVKVAHSKRRIYSMTLGGVLLPNLPPNFLLGRDVLQLSIYNCSTTSVDKDAFMDIAPTLKALFLSENALERVPSKALEKCFNLTLLYLDNNSIDILQAGAFSGLDSLLELSLLGNRIKFIDDSAFVGIGRHFRHLRLGGNELTVFSCLPLRNQSSLAYIRLENNKIAALLPEEFGAMGGWSLKYLYLRNNTIRHLPASVFRSMKNLKHLDVSDNSIESIHISAFEGPEVTLEYLSLGHNHLEEVPAAALKDMKVLKYLYLPGNKICKIRKDDFLTYGENLIIIDLSNNLLEYLDFNAFIGLDSLASMKLGSNRLKTLHFKTFHLSPQRFWKLDIRGNPLDCDCNLRWLITRSQVVLEGRAFWIVDKPKETKCVTPGRYSNVSLADIAIDQLVCDDNDLPSYPPEPCCNCFSDIAVSSNDLMSILRIIARFL